MWWGLPAVDMLMLAVLGVSVLMGLVRGLVFELMALAGWLVAYVAAKLYGPVAAPYLPVGTPDSAAQLAAGFVVVFIASLIIWSLLSRLLRMLVRATPLSAIDRILGALFGALRAVVVLLVVTHVVALTPAVRAEAWQQSQGAVWLQVALDHLRPLLPDDLRRYLPA